MHNFIGKPYSITLLSKSGSFGPRNIGSGCYNLKSLKNLHPDTQKHDILVLLGIRNKWALRRVPTPDCGNSNPRNIKIASSCFSGITPGLNDPFHSTTQTKIQSVFQFRTLKMLSLETLTIHSNQK